MIKIDRSTTPSPQKLRRRGDEDLLRLRDLDPSLLKSKDFKRTIYGSSEVKTTLWRMQHGKCCFCEQELERKHSDVEHFRPKAEAVRAGGVKETGYWWLAYRFENLYFGCRVCNGNKGTHFPLPAGTRALAAEEDPALVPEQALLLDPGVDDPEQHLTFVWINGRGFEIAPLNGSERGRRTKEVLVLDRDDLSENRRKYYVKVLQPLLLRFVQAEEDGDQKVITEIRQQAQGLAASDTRYALLTRVALRAILEQP
ncbi:MAG TPA: hypothetical protein VLQ45_26135 [Thermoanaerobaculia bacterium]|nr:hypothetical protein [Thermoanaerobaculia bacterium]